MCSSDVCNKPYSRWICTGTNSQNEEYHRYAVIFDDYVIKYFIIENLLSLSNSVIVFSVSVEALSDE